jgi:outer membrane protein
MARIARAGHSILTAAVLRAYRWMCVLMLPLLGAGCAPWDRPLPIPPEVSEAGVATRVSIPLDREINPAESVIEPGTPGPQPTEPPASRGLEPERTIFTLQDAIAFALDNSPRLRSARAAIERARGQEQVAFAPFLPQIDLLGQYGIVSDTLAPGIPGNEGFLLADGTGTRHYAQTELGLEWILYDFGRTAGRYRQAGARGRIAEIQALRADQTVEFDVATAYLDVLLARAFQRVQVDAVRRAEAILDDTIARSAGGVALREDALRAQVQLSESREALVLAREAEFDSLARLNNVMGRNAALPLEVVDLEVEPPLRGELADLLNRAAAERPEVRLVRQEAAAAQEGWQIARAEFLPRIFVRAAVGNTQGENVITGWQEGAGLHLEAPIFAGGRHIGELHSAEANVHATIADAQTILDEISLQVNLAYRGAVAARERIALSRTAVVQARENLRLVEVRYRNGDATPTDIVDSEAALTRSQQRFFSATYTYLAALARVDYAVGERQGSFSSKARVQLGVPEESPLPDPPSRLR